MITDAEYKFEFYKLDGVLRVRMSQTGSGSPKDSPIPDVASVLAAPKSYWDNGQSVILPFPTKE